MRPIILIVIILALTGITVYAEEKPTPVKPDFESFRLVWNRNIFSPNRRAARSETRPATAVVPRAEYVSLVGSLIYQGSAYAFFDGTAPEYETTKKVGDSIVGFRVVDIATNGIKLENQEEHIVLPVGMSLNKKSEGKWEIASTAGLAGSKNIEAKSLSDANENLTAVPSDAENKSERKAERKVDKKTEKKAGDSSTNDILQRLKEQREKEMKK